jgi:type II secretory pathway pseudopilin PulG
MSETLIAVIVFAILFAICLIGLAAANRASERLDHARSRTAHRGVSGFNPGGPEPVDL